MSLIPSLILLFDTSALLGSNIRLWQEFSKLGECFLAEAVVEQMEYMSDLASEPQVEAAAREFNRFLPNSGWKKTSTKTEHPSLKPAPGHTLSKRARLGQEVLECAYGLALRYPDRLIVLVANDQPMLQRVFGLQAANLCGMPLSVLVQWARSQRRPPVVTQHLQRMRAATKPPTQPKEEPFQSKDVLRAAAAESSGKVVSYQAQRQRRRMRTFRLSSLLAQLTSLVILVVAIAAVWRVVHPVSFNQFWQKLPIVGKPMGK